MKIDYSYKRKLCDSCKVRASEESICVQIIDETEDGYEDWVGFAYPPENHRYNAGMSMMACHANSSSQRCALIFGLYRYKTKEFIRITLTLLTVYCQGISN